MRIPRTRTIQTPRSHPGRVLGPVLSLAALAALATSAAAQADGASRADSTAWAPIVLAGDGEHRYDVPFFEGADLDPAVPSPEQVLGFPLGSRPAGHAATLACWRAWAEASPRVRLETMGRTYEGRELVVGVVTSPANHAAMDDVLARLRRLGDPREHGLADVDALVAGTPAVGWFGYSIHGDEMSGVDGGLAFAHLLIADRRPGTAALLEDVVVVVDPMMNPDGRERFLSMLNQAAGYVGNPDPRGMHRGRWPYGRGNHYLFDMNRDWMAGVLPETRARWRSVRKYVPQLLVDAHEMGGDDTYLFSPPREPINPEVPPDFLDWSNRFADDQARAFDAFGWSYYTREWFEFWGPYYSESWSTLRGALGILYEQASYDGQPRLQRSGIVDTYGEAAHHQAVSSLANLRTLAANREAMLRWFAAHRRAQLEDFPARAVVLHDARHPSRQRMLLGALIDQGVEVYRAEEPTRWRNAEDRFGGAVDELALPAGAFVVPARQPLGALVRTYFDRDPRMTLDTLQDERHELEKRGETRIYDATAWSFAHALDLDARWVDADDLAGLTRLAAPPAPRSGVVPAPEVDAPVHGWVVDGHDDASVAFAVRALRAGLRVHAAEREFRTAGRSFARGSLLVRRRENGDDAAEGVAAAARAAGVRAFATSTARSPDDGPDLGGGRFRLLVAPRVALVGGPPVAPDRFGHLWHLLDRVVGLPVTQLEGTDLARADLRRYDVLVLPPTWGGAERLLEPAAEALATWVSAGGTLVAMGPTAQALASEELGLSAVRLRRDALDELEAYAEAAGRELAADRVEVDAGEVWGDAAAPEEEDAGDAPPTGDAAGEEETSSGDADEAARARRDAWARRFSPRGAYGAARVDAESWLTFGCGPRLPVPLAGDAVLLAREPVRTPVRLEEADTLRLGGLLWPEARERLAGSAWLTAERLGHGQVVLFATQPGFRGTDRAAARLLLNAVVYGPGLGADLPLPR